MFTKEHDVAPLIPKEDLLALFNGSKVSPIDYDLNYEKAKGFISFILPMGDNPFTSLIATAKTTMVYHGVLHPTALIAMLADFAEGYGLDKLTSEDKKGLALLTLGCLFHDVKHSLGVRNDVCNTTVAMNEFIEFMDNYGWAMDTAATIGINSLEMLGTVRDIIYFSTFPYTHTEIPFICRVFRCLDRASAIAGGWYYSIYRGLFNELAFKGMYKNLDGSLKYVDFCKDQVVFLTDLQKECGVLKNQISINNSYTKKEDGVPPFVCSFMEFLVERLFEAISNAAKIKNFHATI